MSGFPSAASQAGRLLPLTICPCLLAVLRTVSSAAVHGAPWWTKSASFPELKIPSVHLFIYCSALFVAWINSLAWFTEQPHGRGRSARVTLSSACCISLDLVSSEKVCVSQDGWAKFRVPMVVWSQGKHIQMRAISPRACFSELDCLLYHPTGAKPCRVDHGHGWPGWWHQRRLLLPPLLQFRCSINTAAFA